MKFILEPCVVDTVMRKLIFGFTFILLLLANSCQKCYDCKQYCAYCVSNANTGIVVKICADKDVAHAKVDSFYSAYNNSGYSCTLLNNEKKVCDQSNKINGAVDYYKLQDYYCNPWTE